jgi:type VI secretion system protein ImpH
MAGPHRRSPTDLNHCASADRAGELTANAHAFSFFQMMRLLRHRLKEGGSTAQVDLSARIRVRPNLSMAFPAADIERIETVEDDNQCVYHIIANFLGLYGTTSPLPTFYTEDLLNEASQDESASRDFFDLFNQRLYELMFQGCLKYRLFLQIVEEQSSADLERLFCLLGMGSESLRRLPEDLRLLRYIGLFTQFPRSAAGLETLLCDALRGVPVKIVPCISRQAQIPEFQRLRVGMGGNHLGIDCHLGETVEDRAGKFRIRIGPLAQAGFLEFIPGREGYKTLTELTEAYVTDPLEYEVELILGERQAQTVCLGNPLRAMLGVTTWVFSEENLGEVRTRFTIHRR